MTSKRPCACEGQTLNRLLQPTVMSLLADGPQHGYALLERLGQSPLMRGMEPDDTGVYRLLGELEKQHLVRHKVVESELGPSKRVYQLTPSGRVCLRKWTGTLDNYQRAIASLVAMMKESQSMASK